MRENQANIRVSFEIKPSQKNLLNQILDILSNDENVKNVTFNDNLQSNDNIEGIPINYDTAIHNDEFAYYVNREEN